MVDGPVGSVESSDAPGVLLSAPAPNPAMGATMFSLTLPPRQNVRIVLHDAAGAQVRLLHEGMLEAGLAYSFTVDATSLSAGVYHMHAAGENFSSGKSIVVVK